MRIKEGVGVFQVKGNEFARVFACMNTSISSSFSFNMFSWTNRCECKRVFGEDNRLNCLQFSSLLSSATCLFYMRFLSICLSRIVFSLFSFSYLFPFISYFTFIFFQHSWCFQLIILHFPFRFLRKYCLTSPWLRRVSQVRKVWDMISLFCVLFALREKLQLPHLPPFLLCSSHPFPLSLPLATLSYSNPSSSSCSHSCLPLLLVIPSAGESDAYPGTLTPASVCSWAALIMQIG